MCVQKLKNKKDAGTSPDIPAAPTFAEWKAEGKFDEALVSGIFLLFVITV